MKLPLLRRPEVCGTCNQPIVPPPSSAVALLRVALTAGAVVGGVVEYRRALKREREQAGLEQLHRADIDRPLDEHLARAQHDASFEEPKPDTAGDASLELGATHPYSVNPDPNPGDDDAAAP